MDGYNEIILMWTCPLFVRCQRECAIGHPSMENSMEDAPVFFFLLLFFTEIYFANILTIDLYTGQGFECYPVSIVSGKRIDSHGYFIFLK